VVEILGKEIREGLSEEVSFEKRFERGERTSHIMSMRRTFLLRETASARP
jgi:hypothetical protein